MESAAKPSIGVLLLNLGGPDSLSAVQPFLYNLFSDRQIIRLGPAFLQKPLAWLISFLRSAKTRAAYARIGGRSPIREITLDQAGALKEALNKSGVRCQESPPPNKWGQGGVKVYVAMRYWHPLIEDVIPEICRDGVRRLIVLSLYPQYSVATTGSTLAKLGKVISKYPIEIFSIQSWYDNQLYIDAVVDEIKKGIKVFNKEFISKAPSPSPSPSRGEGCNNSPPLRGGDEGEGEVHVLFSAHSLPVKFIREGDPYAEQIQGTINAVIRKIDISWSLSYQSKSGPVEWLEPSTDRMIGELAAKGIKNLLVVPISFVSDHIETLYEIDILYKEMAAGLGMRLERAESLNLSPAFISALKDIVVFGLKEAGWSE